jgi:hypothetical protein
MIDAGFKSNFKKDFYEGRLVTPHLNKVVWYILAIIVSVVLIYFGAGILVIAAWVVIEVIVNMSWSHYDVVHANKDVRKARARAWALRNVAGAEFAGRLVNTRQSNDPIRVIYGICKTGGTWVFNKMSRANSQMMNTIIAWGEGEIGGIATGIDCFPIFSGTTTLNDMHTKGEFVYAGCSCDAACFSYVPCSCNMTCHVY